MNVPEVLSILKNFLAAVQYRQRMKGQPYWGRANAKVQRQVLPVLRIAERVDTSLVEPIRTAVLKHGEDSREYQRLCDAINQLIGAVEQRQTLDEFLGPAGPQLAAGSLHPWVWESASRLWEDGHRRESIQSAATHIDLQLQAKLNSSAAPGSDLVTQAFTIDDPKPNKPRLRFPGLTPGTETWRSAHEGAMSFGRGCFMAIRNLATHTLDQPDEQPALEVLAALSVLARWIDEAEVVKT